MIILVNIMLLSSPLCLYFLSVMLVVREFLLNAYWYMTDVIYEAQQYMQFTSEQEEGSYMLHTSCTSR
jgi:hypothetical protein